MLSRRASESPHSCKDQVQCDDRPWPLTMTLAVGFCCAIWLRLGPLSCCPSLTLLLILLPEESEDMCTHLHRNRPCLDSLLGNADADAASVPQLHAVDTSFNAATAYKRLLYPPVLAPVPVQQGPQAGRRCWRCLECSVVLSWLH